MVNDLETFLAENAPAPVAQFPPESAILSGGQ